MFAEANFLCTKDSPSPFLTGLCLPSTAVLRFHCHFVTVITHSPICSLLLTEGAVLCGLVFRVIASHRRFRAHAVVLACDCMDRFASLSPL